MIGSLQSLVRPRWAMLAFAMAFPTAMVAQPTKVTTATLVGRVSVKESGLPLGNSTIAIQGNDRAGLSDAAGRFTLDVPADTWLLVRVSHVGYHAVTTRIRVPGGMTDSIQLALERTAVALPVVAINAEARCTDPGAPAAGEDSVLASILKQVQRNAERFRVLSDSFPFRVRLERVRSSRTASGMQFYESLDTIVRPSDESWTYRPGRLIPSVGDRVTTTHITILFSRRTPAAEQLTAYSVRIPMLRQIADPEFIASHCFSNVGFETVDGTELVRVDLMAASRIKGPDVNGSLYLDPVTFQLRRSVLRLARTPIGVRDVAQLEFTTVFSEARPWLLVVESIMAEQLFKTSKDSSATVSMRELQRQLEVLFRDRGRENDPDPSAHEHVVVEESTVSRCVTRGHRL